MFKGALEQGGSVRGINAEGQGAMPRKKFDVLGNLRLEIARQLGLLKKDDFKFLLRADMFTCPLVVYSFRS